MRQNRRLLFLFVLSLLSLFFLPRAACAQNAPVKKSKLGHHLHAMRFASRKKLRGMKRFLGVDPEAADPTADVLVQLKPGSHINDLRQKYPHSRFHSEIADVVTAVVPIKELDLFESDDSVARVESSRKSKPNLNVVKSVSVSGGLYLGVLETSADLANVNGSGVIVGVIDTGVDYTHADFNKTRGQPFFGAPYDTRLLTIWDQQSAGTPPGGSFNGSSFNYGNECNTNGTGGRQSINSGACTETDTDGHGTNVMGIAAGNGRAFKDAGNTTGRYAGIAGGADLIMVASDLGDAHVLDGMNYLVNTANNLGKKLVINMSFGGQADGHDGTDLYERTIAGIAANVPITTAMGNDNTDSPHSNFVVGAGASVTSTVNTVTTSGSNQYSEFIDTEYWYPGADDYEITVTVNGSGVGGSISTPHGVDINPPQAVGSGGVTVQVVHGNNSPFGSDGQIFVEVDDASLTGNITSVNYTLTRTVHGVGGTGVVDGYTQPAILGTSFANNVAGFGTLCRPATANNVFAVAAYNTKNSWTLDGSSLFDPSSYCGTGTTTYGAPIPVLGQIADFSAVGPRRNGSSGVLSNGINGAKPDIAAPGQGTASALSNGVVAPSGPSFNPTGGVGTCFVVEDGVHFIDQGTSQATPVATGVIATMLGVNPALTVAQIRAALQTTARVDGAAGVVPNNNWGPGKIVGAPTRVRGAPSPVSSTVMGISSITFTWTGGLGTNATSYNLYDAFQTPPAGYMGAFLATSDTLLALSPNTLYGVQARGVNGYGEGPGATLFVAATLANQATLFGAGMQAFASSITVTFAAGVGGAASYALYGSTSANTYTGTIFSSTTNSGVSPQTLTLTGLASSTNYCLRLAALNRSGIHTDNPVGCVSTTNPYVAPPIVQTPAVLSQTQLQFFWTPGANPPSVNYFAQISPDPTFATQDTTFQGIDQFTTVFSGLAADTSYYLEVRANSGPFSSTGPYATLAGLPVTAAPAFTGIGAASLVANWGYGPNPNDALFLVQASTDPTPAFYPVVASSQTRNNFGLLIGLNANTTYYARVQTIGRTGVATAFVALGAASTLGAPPVPTLFSNQTVTGFTANYTNGGNGPGTVFLAQISVDPTAAFSPVAAASQTLNTFAAFSGLVPNKQYFFRAGAVNNAGGTNFNIFAQEISTFTAPVPPVTAAPGAASQTTSSILFNWGSGANAAGTQFTARDCTDATCVGVVQTIASIAGNSQLFNAGLSANTTYFLQVQALHQGPLNPDSAFVTLAAAATLAVAPTAPSVLPVDFTSFTITFPSLLAAPQSATCEGYRVQAALDPAFASIVFTTDLPGFAANTTLITGLVPATTYYVRVGALNWNGLPDYSASASTMTLQPIQSSGTVSGSGLSLTVTPVGAPVTSIQLLVPPATLPPGTPVTINTSVAYELPTAVSNEAALIPLSSGFGFSIEAAGMQPQGNVSVIMTYNPLLLPPGAFAQNIQLARYDGTARQWTLLPTTVDVTQNVIVGRINHFSLYAPFLVTAGGDLSQINIFPTPWEPLSNNTVLNAPVLTFTNMPANASIRIMAVSGALMWSGEAGSNGTLTWDGTNRFGRVIGSGTYLAIIGSQGKTTVKRLVIIR